MAPIPSANRTGKPVEGDEADRAFNQIAMELLARDTGGHAFYNTNGLSEAMEQAVEEGSHFYRWRMCRAIRRWIGDIGSIESED